MKSRNTSANRTQWKASPKVEFWLVIASICTSSLFFYLMFPYFLKPLLTKSNNDTNNTGTDLKSDKTIELSKKNSEIRIPTFPHCPRNDFHQLNEIIDEIVFAQITCGLTAINDSINNNRNKGSNCPNQQQTSNSSSLKDLRDTIIVYVAVALLMVSMCAAVVEVYKVQAQHENVKGTPGSLAGTPGAGPSNKPELSRRCSLADLTVLRHNRRESMMRRDSAMHMSLDNGNASGNTNSIGNHRMPLKMIGTVQQQRPRLRVD